MKTDHENYCRLYFELVLRALQSSGEEIELIVEDACAIEYYLKDVAKRPTKANATIHKCVEIFYERVKDLLDGNDGEWQVFNQSLRTHAQFIGAVNIQRFAAIQRQRTCTAKQVHA